MRARSDNEASARYRRIRTVDRLACVNLPAFPLQLLLHRHGEWARSPAAVVAEDKPQGKILWVNEKARQAGVLPGLRYAAASSLASGLRAGVVAPAEIEKEVSALADRFMRFTPDVEPSHEKPGVFWLSGAGLNLLYPFPEKWAAAVHEEIRSRGFYAKVVVGFTRFGTYAVAKVGKGTSVFDHVSQERAAAEKISLSDLDLEADLRDSLFKLGIKTVSDFLTLPAGGLYERFGPSAYRLHRMASGDFWAPLQPRAPEDDLLQRLILDDTETDTVRLLFLIKRLLDSLLAALAERCQALAELWLRLLIEKNWREERIRPAAPMLDSVQLMDLVRLRMERAEFSAGINPVSQNTSHVSVGLHVPNLSEGQRRTAEDISPWYGVKEIELNAKAVPATAEQLRLFSEQGILPGACPELSRRSAHARDLDTANRALARLRAEFGDEAVLRAKLGYGHLPEARFAWEAIDHVELPKPNRNPRVISRRRLAAVELNVLNDLNQSKGALVRRILAKPVPLLSPPRTRGDGWLLLGPKHGAVEKLSGPYVISGGWWNREIHREYYFASTRHGDILWIYYDRQRRRWFLQGWVE